MLSPSFVMIACKKCEVVDWSSIVGTTLPFDGSSTKRSAKVAPTSALLLLSTARGLSFSTVLLSSITWLLLLLLKCILLLWFVLVALKCIWLEVLFEILLVLEYWKFCLAIDVELPFDGADCVKYASSELVRVRVGHCGGVLTKIWTF